LPTTSIPTYGCTFLKNLTTASTVTLTPSSGTINGATSATLYTSGSALIVWNGSTWYLFGGNGTILVNGVACALHGTCQVPFTCAGAGCPNGSQVGVSFSTNSALTVSANIAIGDTTFTVTSTTGFPSVGCGLIRDNNGSEYFCWSGITSTTLTGITRARWASTANAYTTAANPTIVGFPYLQSNSISASPVWYTTNQNVGIQYIQTVYASLGAINSISGAGASYGEFISIPSSQATSSGNVSSVGIILRSSCWTGSVGANNDVQISNVLAATGANPNSNVTFIVGSTCTGKWGFDGSALTLLWKLGGVVQPLLYNPSSSPALTSGAVTLSGWGTGASVTSISGNSNRARMVITAGTSPSANPTIVVALSTFNNAPLCNARMTGGNGTWEPIYSGTETTTSTGTMTFQGTPVNTNTYQIDVDCR
jgi:hypothetical protein